MPLRPDIARGVEKGFDGDIEYTPNVGSSFIPKYHVYLFNVGPLKHAVARGSMGTFNIPACEAGMPYSKPLVLPSVIRSSYFDAATYAMKTDDIEAKYVAKDLVNPFLGADDALSSGSNLEQMGVFWTMNETPTEEELAGAKAKLEVFLRKQLEVATTLETQGGKALDQITPTMRQASTYFGEDRVWNKIYKKLGDCPMCGDAMKEGIVKHVCGYIVDPVKAYAAGVIDKATCDDLLERRNELPAKKGK
jgi:hypothetical protein